MICIITMVTCFNYSFCFIVAIFALKSVGCHGSWKVMKYMEHNVPGPVIFEQPTFFFVDGKLRVCYKLINNIYTRAISKQSIYRFMAINKQFGLYSPFSGTLDVHHWFLKSCLLWKADFAGFDVELVILFYRPGK